MSDQTQQTLDKHGRCCGRKPIFYAGGSWRSPVKAPLYFCGRCCREYGPDGVHRPNWAWKMNEHGALVPVAVVEKWVAGKANE